MRALRLAVLTAASLFAGADAGTANDHPVYRGVGVGFVRIPQSGYSAPRGYGYAPVGGSYGYSSGSYGYSYAVPNYGYAPAGGSYGYAPVPSYGYAPAPNYGYASAGGSYSFAPAPNYGYTTPSQGFLLPGVGVDPFQAIDSVLTLIGKIRSGGFGGADKDALDKLGKELTDRLTKIEGRLDTLEKDWRAGKNPTNLSERFKDLDDSLKTLGGKLDAMDAKLKKVIKANGLKEE